MRGVSDLIGEVRLLTTAHLHRIFIGGISMKIAVIIGALVAGVAHGMELAHTNGQISAWTVAGLVAAIIIALGATYAAITEVNSSKLIASANKAIEEALLFEAQAREHESKTEEFEAERAFREKELDRALQLYNSQHVMTAMLEKCLAVGDKCASDVIQTCLSSAANSLLVAFDFEIEDTYTICIYKAHKTEESGKAMLRCVADARKIACNRAVAREWPEGVGITGICYSMGNEIIIPDMTAPELGTVFKVKSKARDHDVERYRSMAAIPISGRDGASIWGVAIASSDRPGHFDGMADGVSTVEPIRAIAALSSLAVKALEGREPKPAALATKALAGKDGGNVPQNAIVAPKIELDQGTNLPGSH